MKKPISKAEPGMALVVVLAILLIVTVLVVALLNIATGERTSASNSLQRAQAEILADQTADLAMGKISDAILQGSQPGKSWASEPGRIWVFNIAPGTGAITWQGVDLFSARPSAGLDNVDLNAPSLSGHFPIAPPAAGNTSATMKVGWNNVLRDPSQPATQANPIIGRVAYWVDDESCKVNLNTADGSRKGNDGIYGGFPTANATVGYSYGFGTPSEISLAALPGLDQTKAAAIADTAWTQEYNSPEEITRAVDAGGNQVVSQAMFENLRFDVTHYNSSPDLNFMGEPRIALVASGTSLGTTTQQNYMVGPYVIPPGTALPAFGGLPLDQLYPQPSQLLASLPAPLAPATTRFLRTVTFTPNTQGFTTTSDNFYLGRLITGLMRGTNLEGQAFTWPKFDGANSAGFAGKYTTRQLDSIALQILDTAAKTTLCDQHRADSLPAVMLSGWLSGQPVMGIGREPKLTEIYITAATTLGDPLGYGANIGDASYVYPLMRMSWSHEFYFPAGNQGVPTHLPYGGTFLWYGRTNAQPTQPNYLDYPLIQSGTSFGQVLGPSATGSKWMDVLLTADDQDGNPAGLNFQGCPKQWDDPDQIKARMYHPYAKKFSSPGVPILTSGTPVYSGDVNEEYRATGKYAAEGIWDISSPIDTASCTAAPGCYAMNRSQYYTTDHGVKPGTTSVRVHGGLQIWIRNGSLTTGFHITTLSPFESIIPELSGTNTYDSNGIAEMKLKVLPVDFTLSVPGTASYLLRTTDPLVSQYPGDWQVLTNPAASEVTMGTPNAYYRLASPYIKGGSGVLDPFFSPPSTTPTAVQNVDGDNPGFRPAGGGDPLSVWLPRLDNRIPKQARFPSVGALFSLRTGLFPDIAVDALPLTRFQEKHGVPFRCLNFAPSTQSSQTTSGGTSYPDWALLDLFQVPFLPQKPYGTPSGLSATSQPYRRLTFGGATVGRININNPPVPYPFTLDPGVNTTPPQRRALQALFYGLKPSNSYDGAGSPIYRTLSATDASTLAGAVAAYQTSNGPFFMAGQIANVPEVANYLYKGNANFPSGSISRNDVVRDTIGAITTRSNVYSVWVVAQTIKKSPNNTNYGTFESGDKVTAEVRRHYLVERFLETGVDGVPGNAVNPVTANTPNTYTVAKPNGDDATATAPNCHPSLTYPLPYRWRVVAVENIQM